MEAYLRPYLLGSRLNFLQACSRTSVIYVPGLSLMTVRRKDESITTTFEAMVQLIGVKTQEEMRCISGLLAPFPNDSGKTQVLDCTKLRTWKVFVVVEVLRGSRMFAQQRGGRGGVLVLVVHAQSPLSGSCSNNFRISRVG